MLIQNFILLGLFLLVSLLFFRFYSETLIRLFGQKNYYIISGVFFFVTYMYFIYFRIDFYKSFNVLLFTFVGGGALGVTGLPLPSSDAGGGEGSSRESGWTDFDLDVLAEPYSGTEMEGTSSGTGPSSTATSNPSVNQPAVGEPYANRASEEDASSSRVPALPKDMAKRQSLEQEIFSLPRLTSTLREAREMYPQISPEAYPPERVFREIISQSLGSEAAVRGMGAAPTQREIRAYILWLYRIKTGSASDQVFFPQPARHPIDIRMDIIPFFRDLAGRVEP